MADPKKPTEDHEESMEDVGQDLFEGFDDLEEDEEIIELEDVLQEGEEHLDDLPDLDDGDESALFEDEVTVELADHDESLDDVGIDQEGLDEASEEEAPLPASEAGLDTQAEESPAQALEKIEEGEEPKDELEDVLKDELPALDEIVDEDDLPSLDDLVDGLDEDMTDFLEEKPDTEEKPGVSPPEELEEMDDFAREMAAAMAAEGSLEEDEIPDVREEEPQEEWEPPAEDLREESPEVSGADEAEEMDVFAEEMAAAMAAETAAQEVKEGESLDEFPEEDVPVPAESVAPATLEDVIDRLEETLMTAMRRLVEEKLPEVVRTVIREEMERLEIEQEDE